MRLFRSKNKTKEFTEVSYAEGDPVEVFIGGDWKLYEVARSEDGEVYFTPYGYTLNLRWLYDVESYKTRQIPETIIRAKEVLQEDINERQAIINHDRERKQIAEIKDKIAKLPTMEV